MTRRILGFLSAGTALVGAPLLAQDSYDLGKIVLSGGFTPIAAESYGRSATVITEEEIAARDARYLADVLRSVPGVAVSRTGSFGAVTQVRIRGHESNHTLVLIDGIEVAATSTGEYDFGGLLAHDIARIEVLRGPQSSIYGSNANGGVISITTKRATEPGLSGSVGAEVGTNGTTQAALALRASGARGDLSFAVARRETDGYDISGTPGGEKDGDLNTTYNLKGRYFVTDTLTVGGTLRYTDRTSDSDDFAFGAPTSAGLVVDAALADTDVQETYGSLFLEAETFGGRLEHRLDLSFADIERQGRGAGGVKNQDNTGTRAKIAYRGTLALDAGTLEAADHRLTFATEFERITYKENDPTIVFAPGQLVQRSREQTAMVLEYQGTIARGLDVQASVRQDFNDKFKDFTTYAVGVSYALPNETTRLHASYGTGVQNPTLIEQFGFFADFAGNPNLEPEQSKGWDIGIEQRFLGGRGLIDVTYFNDRLTDEITSVFDPVTGISTPVNLAGESDRQGIEVAAELAATDRLDLRLSYTWLDATEPNGTVEVRRPEHDIMLRAGYRLPDERTRLNVDISHVAGLYDSDFTAPSFGAAKVKLKDRTLVNMNFTHDLTDSLRIHGGVRNVFDESYQELDGYATEGRTVYVGLTSTF